MINDREGMLEPAPYRFDSSPPPEEVSRLTGEAKRKKREALEAAQATFEANQRLGISSAPEAIKRRYPKLRKLEAEAGGQTGLFPEPSNERQTSVDQ